MIGSTIGSDVRLECRCEASPRPKASWIRYDGEMIANDPNKYIISVEHESYRSKMRLTILNLDEKDFGSYKCVSKNFIGEKEGLIRLYGKFWIKTIYDWNLPLSELFFFSIIEITPPSQPPMVSQWPTYIYTYQGRSNDHQQQQQQQQQHLNQRKKLTNQNGMMMDGNFDYKDYYSQASLSSSSSARSPSSLVLIGTTEFFSVLLPFHSIIVLLPSHSCWLRFFLCSTQFSKFVGI